MSPIADCGFPPIQFVPAENGTLRPVPGVEALIVNGPTTQVEIGFNADMFHIDHQKVQAAIATINEGSPPAQLFDALIDTGAHESCIDEDVAKELELPLIDRIKGAGIGGAEEFNVYLGHIRFIQLGTLQYGRFMGAKLRAGGQRHCALVGRTFLRGTVLVYDGRDGSVRLAL